ncbi:Aminopeptidase N [bacterium HR40]|nr:Aminopeptidase N [bacterium HR40]
MKDQRERRPVRLEDYRPPAFRTHAVELSFDLDAERTEVDMRARIRREREGPLVLYGRDLETLSFSVNGDPLDPADLPVDGETLTLEEVPDEIELAVRTRIAPRDNGTLMGLYESGGILCTQCEAEGFRRITWFQDRPDVLPTWRVKLVADRNRYPVLLSNGNPVDAGSHEDGRHYAVWDDPFPKPSYLFALVAGDLASIESRHRTPSGRDVVLRLWAPKRVVGRCRHALACLERAMRWDEEVFGLECDLDLYQIVAIDDFNFGAMENKGLNIFNSSALLADPDTATDADYVRILRIVAHEYFHNWTGNRVTLRDWFQLTLKEGLTVYRDQKFMEDVWSRAVARISDVVSLRESQFPEDASPLAHPVRPKQYIEINNFYTATVYQKGAEIVRMLESLLGRDTFVQGVREFLRRMDGRAATCEDFLAAMEAVSGRDLSAFARWYDQKGTPRVHLATGFEPADRRYWLEFRQVRPDGGDPLVLPIRVALLDGEGQHVRLRLAGENEPVGGERVLELAQESARFVFEDIGAPVVPSVLRFFSAPVRLDTAFSERDLAHLAEHDDDPVNRWDALQTLALRAMLAAHDGQRSEAGRILVGLFGRLLARLPTDLAFAARLLALPSRTYLAQEREPVDPERVDKAWRQVRELVATAHAEDWRALYDRLAPAGRWQVDPHAVGRRALRNLALAWFAVAAPADGDALVRQQLREADNLTDRLAALAVACDLQLPCLGEVMMTFYRRFAGEPLVVDKWFALQAGIEDDEAVARVRTLMRHPVFTLANPNRVRALLGTFAHANLRGFHRPDGSGYRLLADAILEIDRRNPQLAARLAAPLARFQRLEPGRRARMREELVRLAESRSISRDLYEMVAKSLGREAG